ncbi:cytochrome c oxidase subunit II, partial [Methylobacterium sp. WL69]
PITVQVVSDEAYATWLAEGKTKFARIDNDTSKFAAAR